MLTFLGKAEKTNEVNLTAQRRKNAKYREKGLDDFILCNVEVGINK